METKETSSLWRKGQIAILTSISVGLILSSLALVIRPAPSPASASTTASYAAIVDSPAITITTATADTDPTPTTGAGVAHVQWKFGTVAGSFTTCTVQAKTTFDGTNYLTLGTAVTVTATTGTLNAWTLIAQGGTTSVTTSAASSSAALGFGVLTKYTFACSGGYGTSAPVAIVAVYR